ncbi:hypothetical protein BDC45DRAFT_540279 [Circinella umbellata]|nr:hypothetical protein BDC45DRAFT_540279 [Circinella umbellata]
MPKADNGHDTTCHIFTANVVGLKRVCEGLGEELVQTSNKKIKKSRQDVAEEEKGETLNEEREEEKEEDKEDDKKEDKEDEDDEDDENASPIIGAIIKGSQAMQKKQAVEKLAYGEEKIMGHMLSSNILIIV